MKVHDFKLCSCFDPSLTLNLCFFVCVYIYQRKTVKAISYQMFKATSSWRFIFLFCFGDIPKKNIRESYMDHTVDPRSTASRYILIENKG